MSAFMTACAGISKSRDAGWRISLARSALESPEGVRHGAVMPAAHLPNQPSIEEEAQLLPWNENS
jgi:hypothetical protein